MNVDTRGRQAAEGLRTASAFDIESGLVRVRRSARRREVGRVAAAVVVLAASVGALLAARDRDTVQEPVGPAPLHNGEIVVPEEGTTAWEEFDQPSGTFLYLRPGEDGSPRGYSVVGEDEEVAQFDCPVSTGCGRLEAFGPGADEVSIVDPTTSVLRVVGYDGAVRDTIDLPEVLQGNLPSSIAWSPDGELLAVSSDCEEAPADCEGRVWLLDRAGADVRAVHSEPSATTQGLGFGPLLRELTWSPEGDALAFVVHAGTCATSGGAGPPRLVVVRMQQSGEVAGATTLHAYDDSQCGRDLFPDHFPAHFNLAWSPDGTRLVVTTSGGYDEISTTDGQVLAQHQLPADPEGHLHTGPLAWLRAP
jgi:dipeptidyl aminopeptidase/acylaminoacyl peptidase